jgi:hypothetical protein
MTERVFTIRYELYGVFDGEPFFSFLERNSKK